MFLAFYSTSVCIYCVCCPPNPLPSPNLPLCVRRGVFAREMILECLYCSIEVSELEPLTVFIYLQGRCKECFADVLRVTSSIWTSSIPILLRYALRCFLGRIPIAPRILLCASGPNIEFVGAELGNGLYHVRIGYVYTLFLLDDVVVFNSLLSQLSHFSAGELIRSGAG